MRPGKHIAGIEELHDFAFRKTKPLVHREVDAVIGLGQQRVAARIQISPDDIAGVVGRRAIDDDPFYVAAALRTQRLGRRSDIPAGVRQTVIMEKKGASISSPPRSKPRGAPGKLPG